MAIPAQTSCSYTGQGSLPPGLPGHLQTERPDAKVSKALSATKGLGTLTACRAPMHLSMLLAGPQNSFLMASHEPLNGKSAYFPFTNEKTRPGVGKAFVRPHSW